MTLSAANCINYPQFGYWVDGTLNRFEREVSCITKWWCTKIEDVRYVISWFDVRNLKNLESKILS